MLYLIVLPKPGASGQHAAVHSEGAGQVGSGGQEHATADHQEEQGPASNLPAIPLQHSTGKEGGGVRVCKESRKEDVL